ncbi:MAG: App1 family protein [Saprospiraceae bacterium]
MNNQLNHTNTQVKVYHGYGHKDNLVVFGHVLRGKVVKPRREISNVFSNILHLLKLFKVRPIAAVRVQLRWNAQTFETKSGNDGFFKFEWASNEDVPAGWHELIVDLLNDNAGIINSGKGKIFVPHSTQFGFISDIDDTVLISHSSRSGKKLRLLFTKNPKSRKTFADVVRWYQLLANTQTTADVPNPFFYVSSSEWNLYEDLNEFFKYNDLPKGAFMLNDIKHWTQLLKSGNTKHQGKLIRIVRILEAFPKQRFVLIGDNTQADPDIYASIANKYGDKIEAIYIRNIRQDYAAETLLRLESIEDKSIAICLFEHTDEAILHGRKVGLLR